MKKKLDRKKTIIICTLVPLFLACLYMLIASLNLRGSIWFDESYTAYLIRGDFAEIWTETAADVHPPFFYFVLKIWSFIFGTSDFALRFMSVFFGAVSIILAFHLLKRWFGIKAATVATGFLALSPFLIRYGQEARMYTLVFAIVLGATYALDLAIGTKKKRYYIIYAVLVSLGMWTQYLTALAWLAHVVYIVAVKKINIFKPPFLWTYLLAILLYVPWLPSFLSQTAEVENGFWVPEVSASTLPSFLTSVTVFREFSDEVTGWLVVILLVWLGLLGYLIYRKRKELNKLFICLICVPVILLLLLSMPPLSPVFVPRYVMYSGALVWALAGTVAMLNFDRKKLLAGVFTLASLGVAVVGIVNVETREPSAHTKDTADTVQALAEPGEPTLFHGGGLQEYDFLFYSTDEKPIYVIGDWTEYPWGSMYPLRDYRSGMVEHISDLDTDRFWVIIQTYEDPEEILKKDLGASDYKIVMQVANEYHQAFEVQKIGS